MFHTILLLIFYLILTWCATSLNGKIHCLTKPAILFNNWSIIINGNVSNSNKLFWIFLKCMKYFQTHVSNERLTDASKLFSFECIFCESTHDTKLTHNSYNEYYWIELLKVTQQPDHHHIQHTQACSWLNCDHWPVIHWYTNETKQFCEL